MTLGYQSDESEPETQTASHKIEQECVSVCVCFSYIGGGVQPVCNVGFHGDPLQGGGAVFVLRVFLFHCQHLPLS